MGTSAPFPTHSPDTPLLPDWADLPDVPVLPPDTPIDPNQPLPPIDPPGIPDLKPPPISDDKDRLRDFRRSLTDYIKSSGDSRGRLGNGLRNYVRRSSGGSQKAAARMRSASNSAATLYSVLQQVTKDGASSTLKRYNLEDVANLPPQEILANLIDIVCGANGDKNTGLVREAYIETLCESDVFDDLVSIDEINQDHIGLLLVEFISMSIVTRIESDLRRKIEDASITPDQAIKQKREITGFIEATVRDKILSELSNSAEVEINELEKKMLGIYEISYDLIDDKAGDL